MFPHNFTLAANETMPRAASGSFIYVDAASGPIKIEAYHNGTRVAEVPLQAARECTLPFFSQLYVTDTSGAGNTVRLLIGGEDEGYTRGGSEITGPLGAAGGVQTEQIKPLGPNGGVSVEDPGDGRSFSDLYGRLTGVVEALWQSKDLARAPYTSLENASFFAISGPNTETIVTAAANTGGVVIKTLSLEGSGSGKAAFEVDGNEVFVSRDGSTNVAEKNIHLPAGVKVDLVTNDAGAYARASAEIL